MDMKRFGTAVTIAGIIFLNQTVISAEPTIPKIKNPFENVKINIINKEGLEKIKVQCDKNNKIYQQQLREEHIRKYGEKYEITFYALDKGSCGKSKGSSGYGITANGTNLAGKGREVMVVSVDPRKIPLGSKVEIVFENKSMSHLNGIYYACDTGSAIKGEHIDLFLGENARGLCFKYGKQKAKVKIVKG